MMQRDKDYTPTGLRVEGPYENDRNADSYELLKAMIREAFGTPARPLKDVIIGHHLIYTIEDKRDDGFTYTVVQEIPSIDTFIFDHEVMQRLFGADYEAVLTVLAVTPTDKRDDALSALYSTRPTAGEKR